MSLRFFCLVRNSWPAAGLFFFLGLVAVSPVMAQSGLQATFFRGADFREVLLTRTDATIDFDWDNRSPAPGIPAENYCVRWTGTLQAPVTGTYIFTISTDDGMRVWLGGKRIFDEWRPQSPSNFTTRIALKAGEYYPLRVDYYQLGYQARARLSWQRPDADESRAGNLFGLLDSEPEPIPATALFVRRPAPPATPRRPPTAARPATLPPPAATPTPAPAPAARPEVRAETMPRSPANRPTRPVAAPAAAGPPAPVVGQVVAPAATPAEPVFTRGATFEIKNLFFEQGQTRLLPASAPALDNLAAALRHQPEVKLEISGHTENVGDSTANRRLSEARARLVRTMLITRGIDSVRLSAVGYGGTRPVTNSTEPLQRARNRRVELTVK